MRRHIQSLLRRNGLHYKAECASKTHWRTHRYGWLDRTIADCTGSLKVNLEDRQTCSAPSTPKKRSTQVFDVVNQ
jgi:hypothetical protein